MRPDSMQPGGQTSTSRRARELRHLTPGGTCEYMVDTQFVNHL